MRSRFLFLLLIPVISFSQYNYRADTNCYSSQHIAIPNDSIHRVLFDTTNKMDLFHTVYYLNRKNLLNISSDRHIIASCCVEMFNDFRTALTDDSTQHAFHDDEMNWDVQIYGFLNFYSSRKPIDTIYFGFVSIPEIRIEERMLTPDDFLYEVFGETGMRIERFQFTAFDYSGKPELFWVDYDLFMIALEKSRLKTEDLPWYEMLVNRSYGGFRYKQTACDDPYDR